MFVDVATSDAECELSAELLRDAALYDPEDLVEHFAHAETSRDERVLARTHDGRALLDSAPGRAWQRARQAYGCWGARPAERRPGPDRAPGGPDDAVRDGGGAALEARLVPVRPLQGVGSCARGKRRRRP